MFILRLCGVLIIFVHVSCVDGNSLVSDLNRQNRGLQLEAIRENQTSEKMAAGRNRLTSQLVDRDYGAPSQTASEAPPDQPSQGGDPTGLPSKATSPFKDGGL